MEAEARCRLAAAVEAGQPHHCVAEEEAALQDHAGLLAPAAMQSKEEVVEVVSRPLCPALRQELEAPLQRPGRSR